MKDPHVYPEQPAPKLVMTVKTNPSWDASQSRGVVATIYSRDKKYVVRSIAWSNYEGDTPSTFESDEFSSFSDAKSAAEDLCNTRPSFGDPEFSRRWD